MPWVHLASNLAFFVLQRETERDDRSQKSSFAIYEALMSHVKYATASRPMTDFAYPIAFAPFLVSKCMRISVLCIIIPPGEKESGARRKTWFRWRTEQLPGATVEQLVETGEHSFHLVVPPLMTLEIKNMNDTIRL